MKNTPTPTQDEIRIFLNSFGSKEIHIGSLKDLFDKAHETHLSGEITYQSFYSGIRKLEQRGEIEVVQDKITRAVNTIRLLKMENSATIYEKIGEKEKVNVALETPQYVDEISVNDLPHLAKYLKQLLSIEEAKEKLMVGAEVAPEKVNAAMSNIFTPNPLAEEAKSLLIYAKNLSTQLKATMVQMDSLRVDARTYKQQAEYWRSKLPQATRDSLMEKAPKREEIEKDFSRKNGDEPKRQNER